MDGEEVDNDKGGTMGNTHTEGIEDVGQTAQTTRYKAEGDGDEAYAKGARPDFSVADLHRPARLHKQRQNQSSIYLTDSVEEERLKADV